MKINGKEIKFLRTVKATADLAALCPEGNIERINELFESGINGAINTGAKIIHFLNEGYEMNKSFAEPDYKPNIISVEEILYLEDTVYTQLLKEAINGFTNGAETTVEVEQPKKKEKEIQE